MLWDRSIASLPVEVCSNPPHDIRRKRPDLIFWKKVNKRYQVSPVEVSTGCSSLHVDMADIVREKRQNYTSSVAWLKNQPMVHSVNLFVFLLTPAILMPADNNEILAHFQLNKASFERMKAWIRDATNYSNFLMLRHNMVEAIPREIFTPRRLAALMDLSEIVSTSHWQENCPLSLIDLFWLVLSSGHISPFRSTNAITSFPCSVPLAICNMEFSRRHRQNGWKPAVVARLNAAEGGLTDLVYSRIW